MSPLLLIWPIAFDTCRAAPCIKWRTAKMKHYENNTSSNGALLMRICNPSEKPMHTSSSATCVQNARANQNMQSSCLCFYTYLLQLCRGTVCPYHPNCTIFFGGRSNLVRIEKQPHQMETKRSMMLRGWCCVAGSLWFCLAVAAWLGLRGWRCVAGAAWLARCGIAWLVLACCCCITAAAWLLLCDLCCVTWASWLCMAGTACLELCAVWS